MSVWYSAASVLAKLANYVTSSAVLYCHHTAVCNFVL